MRAKGAKITLLVADDEPVTRELLKNTFSDSCRVLEAKNGTEALSLLKSNTDISAVLLDLLMPETDGYEVLEHMRSVPALRQIPVIVITSSSDAASQNRAFRLGAVDVVIKPLDQAMLKTRVENILEHMAESKKAEEVKWRRRFVSFSTVDSKTGLRNKQTFCEDAQRIIDENPDRQFIIARWDIDRFNIFNDTYGSAEGDKLLRLIGEWISRNAHKFPGMSVTGRYDADHFVSCWDANGFDPEYIYNETADMLKATYPKYSFSIRFGFYKVTENDSDVSVMCDRALLALRTVKDDYNLHYAYYSDSMRKALIEEQEISAAMKRALENNEFTVYYQPQINYITGALIGAEALVRWIDPQKGILPPAKFIPLFEKNGFIFELDRYVWESVCRDIKRWTDAGIADLPSVSVNVSRRDIYTPKLCEVFLSLVEKYGISKSALHLEITESAYMDNPEQLIRVVSQLRDCGFTIEMDDFGSGYSSLNTLKDVPVDILKLDMRFVSQSIDNSRGGQILSSVVHMAHSIGLPVIAEGVEKEHQADYLKSVGCLYMQGYLFGKPMPVSEYETLLYGKERDLRRDERFSAGVDGASDFLDSTTQTTLLFNSFVGGAAIIEQLGDSVSTIRINDNFFNVLGTTRTEYADRGGKILKSLLPESRTSFLNMLSASRTSGNEASCEVCSYHIQSGGECLWVSCRVRFLAEKAGSYIYYLAVENITTRVELMKHNSELNTQLTAIMNGLPGGVIKLELTKNGTRVAYGNDTAVTMFGYDVSEKKDCFEKGLLDFIHPSDIGTVKRNMDGIMAGNDGVTLRYRHICKGGKYKWIQLTGIVMTRDEHTVTLNIVLLDIDRQIANERVINEQREELSAIIENIPGGIFRYSADTGLFTFVSDTLLEMLGYTRDGFDKAFGGVFENMVYEEDRARVLSCIKSGASGALEYRIETGTGRLKWVYDAGKFITDENGNRFIIVVLVDIDERKNLEIELGRSMQEATALIRNTPAGIIRFRIENGNVDTEYVSEGFCRLIGFSAEEMVGTHIADDNSLVHPDDLERLIEAEKRTIEQGAPFCEQYRLRSKNGEYHWISMNGDYVGQDSGNGLFYGTVTDLTEMMELKEKLRHDDEERETLIRCIPGGVATYMLVPGNLRLVYASDGVAALSGHTPEEYESTVNEHKSSYIYPSDFDRVIASLVKAASVGGSVDISYRLIHKNGSIVWINLSGRFMGERDGHPLVYCVFRSLTSSTELYGRILNCSENIISLVDRKSYELFFANDSACKIAGKQRDECYGKTCYGFLRNRSTPCEGCDLAKGSGSRSFEQAIGDRYYTVRTADIDFNGRDACVCRITDRTEVYEARERIEKVLRNIPCGLAVFEYKDGVIKRTFLSEGAFGVLAYREGQTPDVVIKESLSRVHPDDAVRARKAIADAIKTRTGINEDMRITPGDGSEHWINLTAVPGDEKDGTITYYGVYTDISERKNTEERLRVSEAEYRITVCQSGRFVFRYDVQSRSTTVPKHIADEFGISTVTLVDDCQGVAEESTDTWRGMYNEIDRGVASGEREMRFRRADGTLLWYNVRFTAVKNALGATVSAIISCKDITDRRENDKLREFERNGMKLALCTVYQFVTVINLTKNTYYTLNDGLFNPGDIPSEGHYDYLVRKGASTVPDGENHEFLNLFGRENLLKAFSSGCDVVRLEHRRVDSSGVMHWIESVTVHTENSFDGDVLAVTVARNIDKHKADEEALRVSLAATSGALNRSHYYSKLINESAPMLVALQYADAVKPAFTVGSLLHDLGYGGESNETLFCRLLGNDSEYVSAEFKKIRDTLPRQYVFEFKAHKSDGTPVWISSHGTAFCDKNGKNGYICVFTDSTERHNLIEKLRISEQETGLTMARMGKMICRYDIAARTLTVPAEYAALHAMPEVCENVPQSIAEGKYIRETNGRSDYIGFYNDIIAGKPGGVTEIPFVGKNGQTLWERGEFVNIYDSDGNPVRAVIAIEDTTSKHEQADENRRLRDNELVLRAAAQHSERVVYFYNIETKSAKALDVASGKNYGIPEQLDDLPEAYISKGNVFDDSVSGIRSFFADIHAGKERGETRLHALCADGEKRWFDLRYTLIRKDGSADVGAVISFLDVTKLHEKELSYARYRQSVDSAKTGNVIYIESDLTGDIVEKVGGEMLNDSLNITGLSHTAAVERVMNYHIIGSEARIAWKKYYSRESLLTRFGDGELITGRDWQAHFISDNGMHWIHITIQLVTDPYTLHIKCFTLVSDITAEKEALLAVKRRTESDGMTNLLNRVSLAERVNGLINAKALSGMFVLFDLDNLKSINDVLGHSQGDRALIGIANALKAQFRGCDFIGRVGGDEFVVFCKGVSDAEAVNSRALSAIRAISRLSVGENGEMGIRCSAGCVVCENDETSFDELYRKADTALYQVKRNGKNDYAIYVPEMETGDYRFVRHTGVSLKDAELFDSRELKKLITMLSGYYCLVASVNLTRNTYFLLDTGDGAKHIDVKGDKADDLYDWLHAVAGDENGGELSRDSLINSFANGKNTVSRQYRDENGNRMEVVILIYENDANDRCDFTFIRNAD